MWQRVGLVEKAEEGSTLMSHKNISFETVGRGVGVLKINRPKALNALNSETLTELRGLLEDVARDDSVRVLVLTGEGEKAFIAGADISEMNDKSVSEGVSFSKLGHEVASLLEEMPKPTIAAVNGFALGGGAEMAMACDFIVASDRALFGQPEVGLGVIPGFGGTFRLIKFVGLPMAKDLIFSGRKIKADEAMRIGLVNRVHPAEGFLEKVIQEAEEISLNSVSAVAMAKKLMNEFSEASGLDYKIGSEAQEFGALFDSFDKKEGMSAFVEKRKPQFKGLSEF